MRAVERAEIAAAQALDAWVRWEPIETLDKIVKLLDPWRREVRQSAHLLNTALVERHTRKPLTRLLVLDGSPLGGQPYSMVTFTPDSLGKPIPESIQGYLLPDHMHYWGQKVPMEASFARFYLEEFGLL